MQILSMLNRIAPVDEAARAACQARFDAVAKPVGSLGELELLMTRVAAVTGSAQLDVRKKCALIFCADNGVVAQGVAQSDEHVTEAIARMLVNGTSCVCAMASACGAEVFPVDVGMKRTVDGMAVQKVMNGTNDMTLGPAMPHAAAVAAVEAGAALVAERARAGYGIIAAGETGIGNTTTASAMASVLLNRAVSDVTGRGAGLSDEGLSRKRAAIRRAIEVNAPNPDDPLDVLEKLGGLDIAAMTGAFLGGAYCRVPVVMDGVISAVAALTACRICPAVKDYILPSHMSAEPAGALLCRALAFEPVLRADLHLGEGTGAVALFPLLDLAAAVYHNAATFADIAVDDYKRTTC